MKPFHDNLVLSAGFRYTAFNNDIVHEGETQPDNLSTDTVFSYDLGASFNVRESTRVRASVATGYNRFFEKYGNLGTDVLDTTGAGDEVVESRTLEAGLNQSFRGGYVDLAVYSTVQDNVPRRNNGRLESMEVDQSGLQAEVFAGVTPRLTLSAGYMHVFTLEATRADGTEVNGNIFWDGQSTSVPRNQFNLRASYHLTDAVQLWGAGYYSTGYEAVDADGEVVERDAFGRVDLGANWRFSNAWHLRARVENLLDERNFGQTIKGAPSSDDGKLGRVFWVGVDYRF